MTTPENSLYAALIAAGVPIDHHASDLYFQANETSRDILTKYPHYRAGTFIYAAPPYMGELWFDVPFAFDPYWEAKAKAR